MRSKLEKILERHDKHNWNFSIICGYCGEDIDPLVSDYIFELIRNDLKYQKLRIDVLTETAEIDSFHKGDYRKSIKGDIKNDL